LSILQHISIEYGYNANYNEQIFYASIDLNLKEITYLNCILFFILNIFGSIKTITLIHYQAIKLLLKKSKFFKYSNKIKDNLYLD